VFFIAVTLFIGYILYRQEKKETLYIEKSLLIFLIITFASIAALYLPKLRIPAFILSGFSRYTYEVERFKHTLNMRKTGVIEFSAKKTQKGETYVIIIGESLNKRHMSLYGYFRNTTPKLLDAYRQHELVLFNNAYSNHTHTVPVVDFALTEANQYNKKDFFESLSIIDVLKKSNVETYWITNQPIYSIYDNMVSIIATSADHVIALNTSVGGIMTEPKYDGAILKKLEKILKEDTGEKNRVIFIHLGGSHSTYTERYPQKEFTRFTEKLHPGIFGEKASKVKTLNSYDNSVYYNDFVVGTILDMVRKSEHVYALLYMSDHAEDVVNQVGHNSALFTFYMTEIPFIMWFSEKYKTKYAAKYRTLLAHKDNIFSNDILYDTLIGLLDIETEKYDMSFDLSSEHFHFDPQNALVLHGKKHYTDKNNVIYWQKANLSLLKQKGVIKRFAACHTNAVGESNDVLLSGLDTFFVDVFVKTKNGHSKLKTGNRQKEGLELKDFLSRLVWEKIGRIIIDTKYIKQKDYDALVTYFKSLRIASVKKEKIYLSVDADARVINVLEKEGWKVVLRLDDEKIKKNNNEKEAKVFAEEVLTNIRKFNFGYIAFGEDSYGWVTKYLEKRLPQNIEYVVCTDRELKDPNFNRILNSDIFKNMRVEVVGIHFESPFDL
jgi:glucan phosphoethanolaminetransferase (alkaline phosphatase superfamily)